MLLLNENKMVNSIFRLVGSQRHKAGSCDTSTFENTHLKWGGK